MSLALAHLTVPKDGEDDNGDAVVARQEDGWTLLAVVDGLGHGPKAAEAAQRATAVLRAAPVRGSLRGIMDAMHQVLRGTRGAAVMVVTVADGRLEGCGVGNVELRCLEANLPVLHSPGVLGARVDQFRYFHAPLPPRGRLVCFSDGISSRAPFEQLRRLDPEAFCRAVMAAHRKPTDDATIAVAEILEA